MGKLTTLTALCISLFAAGAAFSQTTFAPGAKYTALGSSFAAGPGIDVQLGNCGRSDHNYSHLVAARLGLTLTDVSCNGATTDHILTTSQNGAPLQIEAVSSDTALVTVTIGGNDITFTSSTFACAGKPASERCTANLDQAMINEAVRQLPAKLGATLDAIRARAPQATIVVVTYPRVFPVEAASCRELDLGPEDTAYLAALGEKLESAFVRVAADKKALIADAYVLAEGHGPCDSPGRWVNGATVAENGIRFHPTAEGHIEMAKLVLTALGRNQ